MLNVIKFGSNLVANETGINYNLMTEKLNEILKLKKQGREFVIVSSGAIKLGKIKTKELDKKIFSNIDLQRYSAIGQIELMKFYDSFNENQIVSQILLTYSNLEHHNHIKDLVYSNISCGILTIVNYNDAIDFEGMRYDNDQLSAKLSLAINANRLIIVGNGYDGLEDKNGAVIKRVHGIDESIRSLCKTKSEHGTGGFETKLLAAEIMLSKKKDTIVTGYKNSIEESIAGKKGTLFKY